MGRFVDLTGKKFGRWTAISYAGGGKWNCVCNCGTEKIVEGTHLKSGASKSCGCYNHEALIKRNTTHGDNKTPLHYLWLDINKRCSNPNFKQFKDYGGRGITVCDEWRHNFVAFRDWAVENGYSKGLTIDRIDNDKGYSPENCRFVDYYVQQNNKRSNRSGRLQRGWSESDAVNVPLKTYSRAHDYHSEKKGA